MYSRLLLQERDYNRLEFFLTESYSDLKKDKIFNRSNHNEKLSILTYLTNCFYKTKKYKKSLKYAEKLLVSMKEYDSFLYDKYLFYYYNIIVLNYAKTDKDKALLFLKKAGENAVIKRLPSYNVFIYLNKSLIYYYQNDYKESQKSIARLILQKDFLLLDKSFQLKILVANLMIRILVSARGLDKKIEQIKKEYKSLLLKEDHIRDRKMIDILSNIICGNDISSEMKTFLSYIPDLESEDIDIISYNNWLRINF
tara:strand:- start:142 stop:903 length:762 start_codon:yes stop_codon:yes gene_type:complete